eukprot:CAMPEP_0177222852 /NCGR_PEP_ID=MMETSP0367-20130122/38164_1 /TAXON_ID=447022 ORGANISM="Scrippsiella hangoei-like, Strain SHHI-4" /NCGR_SAMPLE_ID=MMETSP0367 /ASSEMBLY_ACC=CAM_ASM_000362 /LENGTH=80 /DNA_ID=CAMNT_0018672767 /DNA_START=146 /DNA_END=385 /DNA_ORIENTATION=+
MDAASLKQRCRRRRRSRQSSLIAEELEQLMLDVPILGGRESDVERPTARRQGQPCDETRIHSLAGRHDGDSIDDRCALPN